jgi:fatty acid desaturase
LIFLTRNNIFALILHAFFISFVFMPLHECVHETVFQTLSWNRALGLICGLITARPPIHYKYYHYAHHKYTGDKDKDPELEGSLLDPSLNSLSGYFFYLSGIPFWISRASTLFRHAISGEGAVYEFYIRSSKSKTEVVK